jgi:hypothetical protein
LDGLDVYFPYEYIYPEIAISGPAASCCPELLRLQSLLSRILTAPVRARPHSCSNMPTWPT